MDNPQTPPAGVAIDTNLIEYLEHTLALARRGRVVFFVGSASALQDNSMTVLVSATATPTAWVLETDSLKMAFGATLDGVRQAVDAINAPFEGELAQRKPRIVL